MEAIQAARAAAQSLLESGDLLQPGSARDAAAEAVEKELSRMVVAARAVGGATAEPSGDAGGEGGGGNSEGGESEDDGVGELGARTRNGSKGGATQMALSLRAVFPATSSRLCAAQVLGTLSARAHSGRVSRPWSAHPAQGPHGGGRVATAAGATGCSSGLRGWDNLFDHAPASSLLAASGATTPRGNINALPGREGDARTLRLVLDALSAWTLALLATREELLLAGGENDWPGTHTPVGAEVTRVPSSSRYDFFDFFYGIVVAVVAVMMI
ncbi:hypothetical protein T492DRAFT_176574 [Pavlovales sp. CCMP2436]|nr:hypothetical protein T492DRAFT_176574 [Pavlovales sp. CCMP2436]